MHLVLEFTQFVHQDALDARRGLFSVPIGGRGRRGGLYEGHFVLDDQRLKRTLTHKIADFLVFVSLVELDFALGSVGSSLLAERRQAPLVHALHKSGVGCGPVRLLDDVQLGIGVYPQVHFDLGVRSLHERTSVLVKLGAGLCPPGGIQRGLLPGVVAVV